MAERLLEEGHNEVAFVGTPGGVEARLVPEAGIDFLAVKAKGFDRATPLSAVGAAFTTVASWLRCLGVLHHFRPDVVVGFGGYVSLPVGLAAVFTGIPLVIHEQNAVPGLANRVLSHWAQVACVTYPSSIRRLYHPKRTVVTGNPVRREVFAADRARGRKTLKVKSNETAVLVFGGSRGARHLNSAMLDLYQRLKKIPRLRVLHVTGSDEMETVKVKLDEVSKNKPTRWQLFEYIEDMGDALAAADLVVCRAGATTIAELTALGKAALLVPFPYATEDHQTLNAQWLSEAGAAVVVADSALDTPEFADELLMLLQDVEARRAMERASYQLSRPTASIAVAEAALEVACIRRTRLGLPGDCVEHLPCESGSAS